MKIVVIPDTHLLQSLILPKIEATAPKDTELFLFLGDYFDNWNQTGKYQLSEHECNTLTDFTNKHNCKLLLGNHDIPYLTTEIDSFSDSNSKTIMLYQKTLMDIGASLAYQAGNYTFTHAGMVTDELVGIDFLTIDNSNYSEHLDYLNYVQNVSEPSMVWVRPDERYPWNPKYKHQVVGHSPHETLTTLTNDDQTFTYMDTFSLSYREVPINREQTITQYSQIGDGSYLYIDTDTETTQVIQTDWASEATHKQIFEHFVLNYYGGKEPSTQLGG